MAVRIPRENIQNLQQLEATVTGPDGATRLINVAGQFDGNVSVFSQGNAFNQQKETFTALVGPVLTRQQFVRAIATGSITRANVGVQTNPYGGTWSLVLVDADWDDESGQV